ncbi:MAG: tRNA methyltransferase, partial [Rhodospirillaceae bacterium]|nr:tRNA methyltransferase [Rhodospirillaceae bacterium]
LLTTGSDKSYTSFDFASTDTILLGSESSGVPDEVHNGADARLTIPMSGDARSLNVAIACGMVLGEALRQLKV